METQEIVDAVIRRIDVGGYPGQPGYRETLVDLVITAFARGAPTEPVLRDALNEHYGDERAEIRNVLERWALWWELLEAGRDGGVFKLQHTPRG